ncbi:MAG: hypothetical protein V3R37_00545 [Rhodospirillales bacterium]
MVEFLYSPDAKWLWIVTMAAAMFFPVRKLIWVQTMRRAIKKGGEENVDAAEEKRLMRRAGATSALLCFLFSMFYVSRLFAP